MTFSVDIEVTERSFLPNGQSLLEKLKESDRPEKLLEEVLWCRVEHKQPYVGVGPVKRIKPHGEMPKDVLDRLMQEQYEKDMLDELFWRLEG